MSAERHAHERKRSLPPSVAVKFWKNAQRPSSSRRDVPFGRSSRDDIRGSISVKPMKPRIEVRLGQDEVRYPAGHAVLALQNVRLNL
jgi:hypothetical protein